MMMFLLLRSSRENEELKELKQFPSLDSLLDAIPEEIAREAVQISLLKLPIKGHGYVKVVAAVAKHM